MFFITSLIILSFVIYFFYDQKFREKNVLLAKFSTPEGWPLIGQAPYLAFKKNHELIAKILEYNATQPSVWMLDKPFSPIIYINDRNVTEAIMTSTTLIDKSSDYDSLHNWLGTGLLTANGKKWHQRRKIITPAFHFKILEQFTMIMSNHGDVFVEKLRKLNEKVIDIFPVVQFYTLDVICEAAMGYQLNSQSGGNQKYAKDIKELTKLSFLFLMDSTLNIKFLPRTKQLRKRRAELIEAVHDFTTAVITERKKAHEGKSFESSADEFGRKSKLAFLDLLLESKVDGRPLNQDDLREEVDTFMFEGHDTTTSGIAFTFHCLAKHPQIQQKVYEEIKEVLGDVETPTMQDLNKLNYLEKVIKESLRLFPPVPFFSRSFRKAEKIEGYTFPPDTVIKLSPLFLGRNPELFPNPLVFDPSRFDNEDNIKLFSFIPFAAGSRNCIGQKFATLELKNILSKAIKNFEVCLPNDHEEITLASELVLRADNGVNLYFKERSK